MQKHVVLALLFIFIVSAQVRAAGDDAGIDLNQSILKERGADWEDYLNPDGSYRRIIYTGLRNYWNGTGYEPIDTAIVEQEGKFKVEKGAYKAHWDDGKSVRFRKGDYYFTYQGKEISRGKPKHILASIKEGESQKNKNKIKFKGIYPSIDVEYIYYPDLLKENIILNKAPDLSADKNDTLDFSGYVEYSGGLETWVNGTRQEVDFSTSEAIEFRAGDDVEFTLLPPVAEDANNSRIRGEYELVRADGKILLSVKVPYEWLINSSRVYPVVVDPSISIRNSADTFVNEWYDDTNFGYEHYLEVQSWYFSNERILLRFALTSPLPPGATITGATLKMLAYEADTGRTIDVWSVDNYWYEYTVTWNNQPPNITKLSSSPSGLGLRKWDVTSEVLKKWGNPLFLKLIDSVEGNKEWYKYQRYYSWEYSTYKNQPGTDPYLEILYTEPQNDCKLGSDASNTFSSANLIYPPITCSGYLDPADRSDYYRFTVTSGYTIDATMTPPSGANFNLYLYDPNNVLKKWSVRTGDSSESISYTADSSGDWRIEIYQITGSGTYSLSAALADKTPPPAPVISSSTHPDQNKWYSNNNTIFMWTTPSDISGIAGYSYALDQSPSTTPDGSVDTTDNLKSYSNIADGTWYFHVIAKDNAGNWGSASHYKVNIDVTSPSVSISSPANNTIFASSTTPVPVSWSGLDFTSGIHNYEIQLDNNGWINKGMLTSHTFYGVGTGTHTIYVKAVDKAGNTAIASVSFKVQSLPDLSISSDDIAIEKVS